MTRSDGVCDKCKSEDNLYNVRRDQYCTACFTKYIKSKYRKALEAWRIQTGEKDVQMVIALSGGIASCVLLSMLHDAVVHANGRNIMPVAVHIDDSEYSLDYADRSNRIAWMKTAYPMRYVTHKLDATDVYTLKSKTSQEDMLEILRNKAILAASRQHANAVLLGDCATTIAARTLSLTAKGRGASLSQATADHCLVEGIVRPLKQILMSELLDYASILKIPLPKVRSVRARSIDDLTSQYFLNLEQQFPSLIATVVRTTSKLSSVDATEHCKICDSAVTIDPRCWLADITVDGVDDQEKGLCYGCQVALRGSSWRYDKGKLLNEYEL